MKNFDYIVFIDIQRFITNIGTIQMYNTDIERLNKNTEIDSIFEGNFILFNIEAADRDNVLLNLRKELNYKYEKWWKNSH